MIYKDGPSHMITEQGDLGLGINPIEEDVIEDEDEEGTE